MKGDKMNITKKEYDKEYYLRNKEHRLEQTREWRLRNKEKLKIWQHEYYLKNRKQNSELGPALITGFNGILKPTQFAKSPLKIQSTKLASIIERR
jgi:hypothetical protein